MKIKDYIRGDTRPIIVSVVDSVGNPINITGSKVFLTANATQAPADDTAAVITKTIIPTLTSITIAGVVTTLDPILGKALITINPSDTTAATPGDYFYDCQVVDSFGNVTSSIQDIFTIKPDITRRVS